jgi:hypothetical protein
MTENRIDTYKNYWSPKCDDNTNIVISCKPKIIRTQFQEMFQKGKET